MTRRICDGRKTAQKYKGSPRISGKIVKIQTILRFLRFFAAKSKEQNPCDFFEYSFKIV